MLQKHTKSYKPKKYNTWLFFQFVGILISLLCGCIKSIFHQNNKNNLIMISYFVNYLKINSFMRKKSLRLLPILGFLFFSLTTMAQNKVISGVVKSATGEPIAGVSVNIVGTNKGTLSDKNGNYTIQAAANASILFTFTGYENVLFTVKNMSSSIIVMKAESAVLNEVVVVGYGTQKKKDLTGAIRSVNLENSPIANMVTISPLQALQGVPGVNIGAVASAGGAPGVLIRGQRSLSASNAPLIILDGVIFGGSVNEINTQDIATFDVLMDASAAAIYGSRAANGVIMITTKKGKGGKPLISITNNYGVQSWTRTPEMRLGDDFIKWRTDNRQLAGQADLSIAKVLDPKELIAYNAGQNVNWLKEVSQFAPVNDLNVSISGKADMINYYVSGGLLDQKGILMNDNFKKYAFTAKVDGKINSWLGYGTSVYYSSRDYSGTPPNLAMATIGTPFAYKWKDEAKGLLDKAPTVANLVNPFWGDANKPGMYDDNLEKYTSTRIIGYINADIPFIKGLNYRVNISKYKSEYVSGNFRHEGYFVNPDNAADVANPVKYLVNTYGSMTNQLSNSWEVQNLLNYKRSYKGHSFEALAGYQRDFSTTSTLSTSATDFASAGTTVLGYYGLHLANPINQRTSSAYNDRSNLAYLSRLNYNYDNKYYLTLNYRKDGYSAFAEGNKFASFYGGAVAYAISEENFFKKAFRAINYLKLRGAYGQNGNQGIDPYQTLANIASGTTAFGPTSTLYIYQSSLSNKQLSWEKTATLNVGLNFAAFNNRISGDVNLYQSQTTDQLLTRSIPFLTGFNSVRTNIGRVDNKGLELSLTGEFLVANKPNKLGWSSTFNVWLNRNKIVSLYGINPTTGKEEDDLGNRWFIGRPIGVIYDYLVDGIVQTSDVEYIAKYGAKPGDLKIRDINGAVRDDGQPDGKINSFDRTYSGLTQARYSWSFANTFTYNNFQLYFNFNAIMGGGADNYYMYPNQTYNITAFGNNQQQNWLNRQYWTVDNPTNTFTRPNYSNPYGYTYSDSRAFIRLQDLSLQYSLSKKSLDKLKVNGLKFFIAAKNPIVFTKWLGLDPENAGVLGSSQPVFRTINFGTNLNF